LSFRSIRLGAAAAVLAAALTAAGRGSSSSPAGTVLVVALLIVPSTAARLVIAHGPQCFLPRTACGACFPLARPVVAMIASQIDQRGATHAPPRPGVSS